MTGGREAAMSDKASAVEFLKLCASNHVPEAYERFAAADFRHHNPWFRGDAASLQAGMEQNAAQHPGKILEVKQVIADGERVAVHSHVRMDAQDRGIAVVHIFRFRDGRIAELWDVGMPVPAEIINEHGLF
jgi:predicted SnoaL-like aldol condensation-catalyzing enzyme